MDRNTDVLTDDSILEFGNLHKGKTLANVPASYLLFVYENNYNTGKALRAYIEDNMDVLKKQRDEEPKY
jgi:uncharacterized protein (DUF3820 family)